MEAVLESAKLMNKGQVTIPKGVRTKLNLNEGDQLVFVYDNEKVIMMNSAVYAMRFMQDVMKDVAKKHKIKNEEDVIKLIKKNR